MSETDSIPAEPVISVITATKNAEATISGLHESLKHQEYRYFEWIVIDGESTDATLPLLEQFSRESRWLKYRSAADSGIYDAINKGISMAAGCYYVVAGADDRFEADALENYARVQVKTGADVVLAKVFRAGAVVGGFNPRRAWLGHSKVFRGSHSVGMLFRKSLHAVYGPYSFRFRLLADGYFLKLLLNSGKVKFVETQFVAGTFALGGVSSIGKLQTLVETWQIQMLTERFRLFQTALFMGKIIVRYPSVHRELESLARRR